MNKVFVYLSYTRLEGRTYEFDMNLIPCINKAYVRKCMYIVCSNPHNTCSTMLEQGTIPIIPTSLKIHVCVQELIDLNTGK